MTISTTSMYQIYRKKLCRKNIIDRIKFYGFIECGDIFSFLNFVCSDEKLDVSALRYIHGNVSKCLMQHASDSVQYGLNDYQCYFQDLRLLKDELEFVISLTVS